VDFIVFELQRHPDQASDVRMVFDDQDLLDGHGMCRQQQGMTDILLEMIFITFTDLPSK
jgi:hypothetical protein